MPENRINSLELIGLFGVFCPFISSNAFQSDHILHYCIYFFVCVPWFWNILIIFDAFISFFFYFGVFFKSIYFVCNQKRSQKSEQIHGYGQQKVQFRFFCPSAAMQLFSIARCSPMHQHNSNEKKAQNARNDCSTQYKYVAKRKPRLKTKRTEQSNRTSTSW